MNRFDVQVDVTEAAGFGDRQVIAATVFMPDGAHRKAVLYSGPGGGYNRQYFDVRHPGFDGYSQAEHHVRNGFAVVAYDHLGVGESTTTQVAALTLESLARANDAAVRALHARVEAGEFGGSSGALRRVGLGQSMGGAITIVAQGRHATFDAIGILGFSAIRTCLPQPGAAKAVTAPARGTATDATRLTHLSDKVPDFVFPFHWGDTPKALLDADMSGGYPMRRTAPAWGSTTLPFCAATLLSPGCVAAEAASIEVPVLVGVGERDVCPTPQDEPSAYPRARSVEVCVVEKMAHMHNFASTRAVLWARIEAFVDRALLNPP